MASALQRALPRTVPTHSFMDRSLLLIRTIHNKFSPRPYTQADIGSRKLLYRIVLQSMYEFFVLGQVFLRRMTSPWDRVWSRDNSRNCRLTEGNSRPEARDLIGKLLEGRSGRHHRQDSDGKLRSEVISPGIGVLLQSRVSSASFFIALPFFSLIARIRDTNNWLRFCA